MCNIWQKHSTDELTPEEVRWFFRRAPHFRWVHLTGGELFVRRDLEEIVAAIQEECPSLFLLNFPTTGWYSDRTVSLVKGALARQPGRLMVTISIDGPRELHERLRGIPGSWERGIETFRRLRELRQRNFQVVAGMTLLPANVGAVDDTIAAIAAEVPGFTRADLHLNLGHESSHYFANVGSAPILRSEARQAFAAHRHQNAWRAHPVAFLEDRYQALLASYLDTGRSPLPCTALSSSCFVDPHWNVYACTIWDAQVGNLRAEAFDLAALWRSPRRQALRAEVTAERCAHCWTPCEAYPTILGNLLGACRPRLPVRGSETIGPETTRLDVAE